MFMSFCTPFDQSIIYIIDKNLEDIDIFIFYFQCNVHLMIFNLITYLYLNAYIKYWDLFSPPIWQATRPGGFILIQAISGPHREFGFSCSVGPQELVSHIFWLRRGRNWVGGSTTDSHPGWPWLSRVHVSVGQGASCQAVGPARHVPAKTSDTSVFLIWRV